MKDKVFIQKVSALSKTKDLHLKAEQQQQGRAEAVLYTEDFYFEGCHFLFVKDYLFNRITYNL